MSSAVDQIEATPLLNEIWSRKVKRFVRDVAPEQMKNGEMPTYWAEAGESLRRVDNMGHARIPPLSMI